MRYNLHRPDICTSNDGENILKVVCARIIGCTIQGWWSARNLGNPNVIALEVKFGDAEGIRHGYWIHATAESWHRGWTPL